MRATAALQWRFGSPQAIARLEREAAAALPSLRPLPGEHNRTMGVDEGDAARRRRRAAFLAVLLRRAYGLGWMPAAALLHLSRVDVDAGTGSVLITLANGARILDTGDRITLRGDVGDLSTGEMAECALRRGWGSVVLTGDEEFRATASRALLRRGIRVVDCPLPASEQKALLEGELAPLPSGAETGTPSHQSGDGHGTRGLAHRNRPAQGLTVPPSAP